MIEPKRLLDGEGTEFERQLLCSVVSEAPTGAQRLHMMRGISVVGPVLWTAQARAAAESAREGVVRIVTAAASKGTVGIAMIGLAAGGAYLQFRTPEVAVAPASIFVADVAPANVAPAADEPTKPTVAQTVVRNTLAQEVELLDRARTALREQQPDRAAAALDEYRQRFAQGVLIQEASVLRTRLRTRMHTGKSTEL